MSRRQIWPAARRPSPSLRKQVEQYAVKSPIHILHLEDDPVDSQLAQDLLKDAGLTVELERVYTMEGFQRRLAHPALNLILSDYTIPGMSALDALGLARRQRPEVPFIFLSGTIGEEMAIQVLKQGATDYILKEHMSRLPSALERALREAEEQARIKQREAELARTSARLDGIISSAMDAIISINDAQQIVLFNPAAEKMFGLPASEAMGQPINRFIPQRWREAHTRFIEEFGRTGISSRAMGRLGALSGLRASGEEFPIEASISQVEVQDEKLYTVILRDITARKEAEEKLQSSRAELEDQAGRLERVVAERTARLRETNAELEAFCYSLSHDMRAPLRAIQNFTQFVVEDSGPQLTSSSRDYLARVSNAGRRLDNLIRDVLAFSRLSREEIKLEPVSLEKVLKDLLNERPELQPPAAQVRLELPLPEVYGHEASLSQCLSNLLGNAVKFVAPGVRPQVRVRSEREGDRVRLWIEDNGIGIEKEVQGKIFEVFQRGARGRDYEGTGIGLAIVRRAATRLGGAVGVQSEPGQGSRFWLELKAA
jgi:PAS domain S-box-containing protein